jgi:hypothetical protein
MKYFQKKLNLGLALFTIGAFAIGCGGDDEPDLFSAVITAPEGLVIEMSWTINGEELGYEYVDIDYIIDDLDQEGDYEFSAGNPYDFEQETISGAQDGTYYFSTFIYEFEVEEVAFTETTDIDITYTIYPAGDSSSPLVINRTITSEYYDSEGIITRASHTITKDGNEYTIKELKKEEILENGYNGYN